MSSIIIDSSSLNGNNGYIVEAGTLGSIGNVIRIGDFNGDGLGDYIFTTNRGSSAYFLYGSSEMPAIFNVQNLNGINGFTIQNVADSECCGVGDFNDDGYQDIVAKVVKSDGEGGQYYAAAVVYGSNLKQPAVIDPSTQANIIIYNSNMGPRFVDFSFNCGGDFNGDENKDLIFNYLGYGVCDYVVYVVYGGKKSYPSTINMDNINRNGYGFVYVQPIIGCGVGGGCDLSQSLYSVGDVNGDRKDDFIVETQVSSGYYMFYTLYGGNNYVGLEIDPRLINGKNGFVYIGRYFYGFGSLGDFDNDGRADLLINKNTILWGVSSPNAQMTNLDYILSLKNRTSTFNQELIYVGENMGDFNGDGLKDVILSSDLLSCVVFGDKARMQTYDLSNLDLEGLCFDIGSEAVNFIGDLNGDKLDDVAVANSNQIEILYGMKNLPSQSPSPTISVTPSLSYSQSASMPETPSQTTSVSETISQGASRHSDSSTNDELIIGLGVGGVIALGLVSFLFYKYCYTSHANQADGNVPLMGHDGGD